MKLRIVERGWDGFTGNFGNVEFADGVSVRDVTPVELDRISALIAVRDAKTDEEVGPASRLVGGATIPASVLEPLATQTDKEKEAEAKAEAEKAKLAKAAVSIQKFHTEEELEAIASEKGLKGLREIAGPLGVKGRSINELIAEILKAESKIKASVTQAPAEVSPEPEASPETEQDSEPSKPEGTEDQAPADEAAEG